MSIGVYKAIMEKSEPSEIREGRAWYAKRSREVELLSLETGYSREQVAGVIAVLSPMVEWSRNYRYAVKLLKSKGKSRGPGFRINRKKALAILKGDLSVIRGPKVKAFYCSLLNPSHSEPVIDTQMIAAWYEGIAYRDDLKIVANSDKRLTPIREGIKTIAAELKWAVAEVQAVIWLTFKRLSGPYADQLKLWR